MLAGGAREQERGDGAGRLMWRPGEAAGLGSLGSEHSSRLGLLQLRPSVGARAVCRCALRWLCDLSTASLRPPWPLLNPLLPSQ